jgi:hypothetical protein
VVAWRDVARCEEIGKEVAHAVPHAVALKITRTSYLAIHALRRPGHAGKTIMDRDPGARVDRLSLNPL